MGIDANFIDDLIRLHQKGALPDSKTVMELGAQQLANEFLEAESKLATLYAQFGCSAPDLGKSGETRFVHGELRHLAREAPWARPFWESLGFRYASIDIDGSPGSIPLDLNFDEVPNEHRNAYGVVTNFGTTEHVANQLNAFKVIHDLTTINGLMIHIVPAQGYMNHGLVNYNAKFFWMLARSNGYHVVDARLSRAHSAYRIPADVLEFIRKYQRLAWHSLWKWRVTDTVIGFCLRKAHNVDYVTPLDWPTGTPAANDEMRRRYWTVFADRPFG